MLASIFGFLDFSLLPSAMRSDVDEALPAIAFVLNASSAKGLNRMLGVDADVDGKVDDGEKALVVPHARAKATDKSFILVVF